MTTLEWILIGVIAVLVSILIVIAIFLHNLGKAFFYHDVPKKIKYKTRIGRNILVPIDELENRGLL